MCSFGSPPPHITQTGNRVRGDIPEDALLTAAQSFEGVFQVAVDETADDVVGHPTSSFVAVILVMRIVPTTRFISTYTSLMFTKDKERMDDGAKETPSLGWSWYCLTQAGNRPCHTPVFPGSRTINPCGLVAQSLSALQ